MSKFKTGDKVRYINTDHDTNPDYYPPYGTIGVFKGNNWVQWPTDVTSGDGYWCCDESDIELVIDEKKTIDTNMTNEEIWEMLKPKMEKNKILNPSWGMWGLSYYEKDVHNAIAIAYRSGYERAMKGRPFKIGEKKPEEKKQGGHWEPVDPKSLPKEGTKVRYSRECEDYVSAQEMIMLGDIGEFSYSRILNLPGIRFDDDRYWDWVSFSNALDCLDMWVEDDE